MNSEEDRKRLLYAAKHRAKVKKVPFNLTKDDFHIPSHCPILGIRLSRNKGGTGSHAASPTLDRMIPRKGYVPGNVIVISHKANSIKNYGNPDELDRVASFVRQFIH